MSLSDVCEPWEAIYPCDVSTESPDCLDGAVQAASMIVWALSGRQYGLCSVTVRPCRAECTNWSYGWQPWVSSPWPVIPPIGWYVNLDPCVSCGASCSCSALQQAKLPFPVHDIVRVRVNGSVLVTGAYRVDDNRWLVRVDGGVWPVCNDLTRDDMQTGTWSVTARYGQDPPELGKRAVGEVACEVIRASRGEDCRLPRQVSQLVRQGVTISYPDVGGMLDKGRTGLMITDLFLTAVNPHHLARRSRVFNVDEMVARRVGT